ncbi:GLI pathogenesis-related 2, like isoform X1 [Simochromis diagramma]|uniref:GLI pathogenesis-related 2, like isoform X1 n=1 Tax=Simochromis diagramma TaxID=43689 RepID=UPI001A7EDF48|nr:GLI pathogenesis-related 2, like isoform X1 [Simochromis diagramma]
MGKSASKQFAEEVLRCHNDYRMKHQAPPLKLSSKLSKEAARYAESLASTRILKHSVESSRGSCGENLAWASYDQTGKDVADRWYDEVKQYNFNRPGFSSGTGEIHAHLSLTVFFHLLFFQFVVFSVSLSFFCLLDVSFSLSVSHLFRHGEGCCYSCADVTPQTTCDCLTVTSQGETEGKLQSYASLLTLHVTSTVP